jgi:CheY-like chemotaxis protein
MNSGYILIAEDDEDDQFLLVSAFKEISGSIELIFVDNGIELIKHFQKFDAGIITKLPCLLIVDLNMPKKSGKEAIKELIGKEYFKLFPTIVFSTTGNELEKKRCKELGIEDFFVKPSNYSSLISVVSHFNNMAQTFSKEI